MTTTFSDCALQLLNVPPAKCCNELISQNHREESLQSIISDVYFRNSFLNVAIQDENRNPTEIFTSHIGVLRTLGYRRSSSAPIFWKLLPHHATSINTTRDPGTMNLTEILFGIPYILEALESGYAK